VRPPTYLPLRRIDDACGGPALYRAGAAGGAASAVYRAGLALGNVSEMTVRRDARGDVAEVTFPEAVLAHVVVYLAHAGVIACVPFAEEAS
jgi:hypothetical protein